MAYDDTGTILELYKTAVEMADRTSARRAGANSFFLTLNTALAAVVGIVSSARKPPPNGNLPTSMRIGLVLHRYRWRRVVPDLAGAPPVLSASEWSEVRCH